MLISKIKVPLALLGLMVATRFHHFGDALSLPDASLAVFFFAGLWVMSWRFFAVLLVAAAGIDYVAITQFNVSDYCVSPAYSFLILAYGCLWLGGRYCSRFNLKWKDLGIQFVILGFSASLAFIISNASFYLFSGKFADLNWLEYSSRVEQYYVSYLGATLVYGGIIFAIVKLLKLVIVAENAKSIA